MDQLGQEVEEAANAILDILSSGEAARPTALVTAVEHQFPAMSRDVIRGGVWSLLNSKRLVATGEGTVRRLTDAERTRLIDQLTAAS